MDFKSSFIPKKPVAQASLERHKKKHTFDPLSFLAWAIFFIVLLVAGSMYGYRILLDRNVVAKLDDIAVAKADIDPKIVEDLKRTDARFKAVASLLDNHVALSPVFDYLEEETLTAVGFTDFDFSRTSQEEGSLSMSGEARDFASITLQSDAFKESDDFISPVFSNFDLDERGDVGFSVDSGLTKDFLLFKNYLANAFGASSPDNEPFPTDDSLGAPVEETP